MGSIRILLVLLIANFVDGVGQRFEVLFDRLVNQHVAVSQIEYLLDKTSLQQTIYNLESSIGLTSTSSHHQEHALLTLSNSIDRAVYGIALIVTRRIDVVASAIRLIDNLQLISRKASTIVAL